MDKEFQNSRLTEQDKLVAEQWYSAIEGGFSARKIKELIEKRKSAIVAVLADIGNKAGDTVDVNAKAELRFLIMLEGQFKKYKNAKGKIKEAKKKINDM